MLLHKVEVDLQTDVGESLHQIEKKNYFLVIKHAHLTMLDKYDSFFTCKYVSFKDTKNNEMLKLDINNNNRNRLT